MLPSPDYAAPRNKKCRGQQKPLAECLLLAQVFPLPLTLVPLLLLLPPPALPSIRLLALLFEVVQLPQLPLSV